MVRHVGLETVQGIADSTLDTLSFRGLPCMSNTNVNMLRPLLGQKRMRVLELTQCTLRPSHAVDISRCTWLTRLNLSNNPIGDRVRGMPSTCPRVGRGS